MGATTTRRAAVAVEPPPTWAGRAWRWSAGTLSAGAALVSIMSSVRAITGTEPVRWIGVSPAVDTAFALGDTLQLATTITDAHGSALPGFRVGWTSTDTAVALVDSSGTVVVRAPGVTTIVAAAGGRLAQSRIVVRPRSAGIRFQADSVLRWPEDTTGRLVGRLVDARGHVVAGQTLLWRSADPSVVAMDSTGQVRSTHPGRTTLVASGDDVTRELPVEIHPVPDGITVQSGDGLRATAGQPLPGPIIAQVVSRGGRPLPGVVVRLTAPDGPPAAGSLADTSDSEGLIHAAWALGDRPGRQRLSLAVDGRPAVRADVLADADPRPDRARLSLVAGPAPTPAGGIAAELVELQVTDTTGLPLGDVLVGWRAADGGVLSPETDRTDSSGRARARWRLGPRAGRQHGWAEIGSGRAALRLTLEATALPGRPAAVVVTRPGTRVGTVGGPARPAIELRVVDGSGNAVPGVALSARVAGGAAMASPTTDSVGRATVGWILGPVAGGQRLTIVAEGVATPLDLLATASAAAAAKVSLTPLPGSAPAGHALARPVEAVTVDRFGNPVAGAMVTFRATAGKVTPTRVRAGSNGRAAAHWVLGNRPGSQRLEAAVAGLPARATTTIKAVR